MKNFDWEEFESELISVHCKTKEEANNFIKSAEEHGIKLISKYDSWNFYKAETGYICYSFKQMFVGNSKVHKRKFKIVEWSDYMKAEFKVGDRVKCIKTYDNNRNAVGKIGTVIDLLRNGVVVQFDEYIDGHDGTGNGKCGYCWVFCKNASEYLIPYKDNRKIVITTDGKTTTAKLYKNGKLEKKAKAKCSPEDEFSFKTGAKLAISRVFGFEVGDIVKVKDWGLAYSSRLKWVEENAPKYIGYYSYGNIDYKGNVGFKIVAKKDDMCLIQATECNYGVKKNSIDSDTCFLINEKGLEKA